MIRLLPPVEVGRIIAIRTMRIGIVCGCAALGATGCDGVLSRSEPEQEFTLEHDGRTRDYLVFASTGDGAARPVVLALHGGGGTAREMNALTGLNAIAAREGFIVVYPQGMDNNWNDGRPEINSDVDDVGFIRALLDDLRVRFDVDSRRIYATGISNGGHLCHRLALELDDRIAAIAPVAAALSVALADATPPVRAVPILTIFGEADPIAPFSGGQIGAGVVDRGEMLSVEKAVATWVAWNHASVEPEIRDVLDSEPLDGTLARREVHAPLADGAEVQVIVVAGGGHAWPGGQQYLPEFIIGRTSRDFSASEEIWGFFTRQALPG